MVEINVLSLKCRGLLLEEEFEGHEGFVSLESARAVVERNGFKFDRDCADSLKFRDEKHGTYESVHIPSHRLCIWIGWLEPLIGMVAEATGKTDLEVLRELLVESGHTLVIK